MDADANPLFHAKLIFKNQGLQIRFGVSWVTRRVDEII